MWHRGKVELSHLGIRPEQWVEGWRCRINRDDAYAIGEVALLGCDWEEADVCTTSFQATTDFELPGIGKQVTKAIRKAVPELMKRVGARKACIYSLCVDPEAPKWFRVLGFDEDKDFRGFQHGPYTSRRFVRRS